MKKIIILCMALVILSGCTRRVADLTVVSTKNFNMNSGNLTVGARVEGQNNIPVFIFPLGTPNLKEAVDRAIEKEPCAVGLSNAVIYQYVYSFLFGYMGISVKGNLILDNNQPGCGGYPAYAPVNQPSYQSTSSKGQYINTSTSAEREQKIQQLKSQNLPYDEYQRRYNQIMAE